MGTGLWPWLALAGLGAYHGINPAMGWLFAVALGLHRHSRSVVLEALVPIAIGHALSIAIVATLVVLAGFVVEPRLIQIAAGLALIGWALWHWRYGSRHRVRVGMTTGMAGLALWSFLMASAHGAGLMLVPALLPMGLAGGHAAHAGPGGSLVIALAAIGVHTAAMLAVTGLVAFVVYEWLGLAMLRRAWINLDLLWTIGLVATGLILLLAAGMHAG
jgi:hypothetical protein